MKSYIITIDNIICEKYLYHSKNEIFGALGELPKPFLGMDEDYIYALDDWPDRKYLTFTENKATTVGSPEKPWSASEKACWYSHFSLWKLLVRKQEYAWIFEHDVLIDSGFLPDPQDLYGSDHVVMFGNKVGSGEAYCASPKLLACWIEEAQKEPLRYQVDTWMYDWFNHHPEHVPLALQKTRQFNKYGTTIKH